MPDLSKTTEAAALLGEVKNFLDITWEDEDLDDKLTGMISRSMAAVQRLTPNEINWKENEAARTLLFNRVMYDRDKRLDEFHKNWLAELYSFQLDEEVDELGKKGQPDI